MSQIRRVGYLLVALFFVALAVSKFWTPPRPPVFGGIPGSDVPQSLAGFVSQGDYKMDADVLQALSTADVISRTYYDGSNQVDFVLIGGTDRGALHDPRSCLVGAGWSLENDHSEALPGTDIQVRSVHAVGAQGNQGMDILYVYMVNGKVINEPTQIRFAMLMSALLGRQNTPVYFLRFVVPDDGNGGINPSNHAAMQRFAAGMWSALYRKLTAS